MMKYLGKQIKLGSIWMKLNNSALLFPGQGSHSLEMLDGIESSPTFDDKYQIVKDVLKSDPLKKLRNGNDSYLNQNNVSSILTVLSSAVSLDILLETEGEYPAKYAGYSVGQWVAIYASGSINFETLVEIVEKRSHYMDQCFNEISGGMLAVIGLKEDHIEHICNELRMNGEQVYISNYNCEGQYSIAGTVKAIHLAYDLLQSKNPKKILIIPVSGAWHCPLLNQAEKSFYNFIDKYSFKVQENQIIDNVNGEYLPTSRKFLVKQVSKHISSSVKWKDGIKTLLNDGIDTFIEVGFGNMLTKFDFFIDRSVKHLHCSNFR